MVAAAIPAAHLLRRLSAAELRASLVSHRRRVVVCVARVRASEKAATARLRREGLETSATAEAPPPAHPEHKLELSDLLHPILMLVHLIYVDVS